ncbi:MAG: gliding motility-associated C-terminal domain-containing protein [Bacteroidota bacterium]
MKIYLLKISCLVVALVLCSSAANAQMRVVGTDMLVAADMRVVGDVDNAGTHAIDVEQAAVVNVDGNFTSAGNPAYTLEAGTDLQIQNDLRNQTNAQLVFAGVGGLVTLDGGTQIIDGNDEVIVEGELALVNGTGITKTQFVDVRAGDLTLNDCELQTQTSKIYVTNNTPDALDEAGGWVSSQPTGFLSRAMTPANADYLFPVGAEGISGSRRDLLLSPQNALADNGFSYGVRLDAEPSIFPPTSDDPADSVICQINPNYHWEITDTSSGNADNFTAQFVMSQADDPWLDSVAYFDNPANEWRVLPNQNATPVIYTAPLTFEGDASQAYYAGALVNPEASDFSWLPDFPAVEEPPIRVGDTIQFFANQPNLLYNWQFGDGGSALTEQPQYIYDRAGRYDVSLTLVRRDAPNCFASGSREIKVLQAVPLFLPTAFTPGSGDQLNDTYYFSIENMEYVNFSVFNRWGQKIFEQRFEGGTGAEAEWDGTYEGAVVPEGVYVYMLDGVNAKNGQEITQNGSITVIR